MKVLGQLLPCATTLLSEGLSHCRQHCRGECRLQQEYIVNQLRDSLPSQVPPWLQVRAQRCGMVLEPPRLSAGSQACCARCAGALAVVHHSRHLVLRCA